jgi:hypothetical protein
MAQKLTDPTEADKGIFYFSSPSGIVKQDPAGKLACDGSILYMQRIAAIVLFILENFFR